MKKIILILIFCGCFLFPHWTVNAEVTDQLYIDVTIQEDGSILVKEIAALAGSYNGRLRDFSYRNSRLPEFTGSENSFGGSAIYNGSKIRDLKVYDIADDIITWDSFSHLNKQFEETSHASSGDYGVYEMDEVTDGVNLKIYNPSSKGTAFYIEYIVDDAVVVHEDVAELYWNLLGDSYQEDVTDFEARIHLPQSDTSYRVWLHGPLYGVVERTDDQTSTVHFKNLEAYEAVSIRLMFDKNLVPNATKKSGVMGRESILSYEQKQADLANEQREQMFQQLVLEARSYLAMAEKYLSLDYYDACYNLVMQLKESEEKDELLSEMERVRAKIEEKLVSDARNALAYGHQVPSRENYEDAKEAVMLLQTGSIKEELEKDLKVLEEEMLTREQKMQMLLIGITVLWAVLLFGIVFLYLRYDKRKYISSFQGEYYREFPADYEPGVIQYAVSKNITQLSFSAAILDLIRKKKIKMEDSNTKAKNNYILVQTEQQIPLTKSEELLLELLFTTIGKENQVTLNQIKHYGSTETKARKFMKSYRAFVSSLKATSLEENFYRKSALPKIVVWLFVLMLLFVAPVFGEFRLLWLLGIAFLYALGMAVYFTSRKFRTSKGKTHYEMWMAHKRFLLDFGRFQEKELPEIHLWDRYMVTATVLGCSKELQKSMELQLDRMDTLASDTTSTIYPDMTTYIMMRSIIRSDLAGTVNQAFSQAVSASQSTIAAANAPSSSGGGFGGGSSGGGGFGGGGGGGGRF